MEILIFMVVVGIFVMLNPKVKEIVDTNLDTANELAKQQNQEIKKKASYDYDKLLDESLNSSVTNNYTQNNIYVQNNYSKKKKKKSYTKTYSVHTSETGLAKKLLNNTGSKRAAKDILVDQYGYTQKEAKRLAGYRGY